MNKTPTKIGFIPSSTPINSLYDSGYVGSKSRSVAKKLFHALSPIKEDPLRTKKICNEPDSGIFLSPPSNKFDKLKSLCSTSLEKLRKTKNDDLTDQSSLGVVRKLKFNESSVYSNNSFSFDESKSECKDKIVTLFPLSSLKCMRIKLFENLYKITLENSREKRSLTTENKKVDIFSKLKSRNCYFIISNVLSHLSAQDLCHVYGVSKTWQEIVVIDKDASARRKTFLKKKKSELENQHKSRLSGTKDRYDRSTIIHQKLVFGDITNVIPVSKQDMIKPHDAKFESFIKEGKKLQNGLLMKCPKCSFAAKKQNGNEYICTGCQHGFCKQCLCPFVKFHDCGKFQAVPMTIIGSKKSKKNLRRL